MSVPISDISELARQNGIDIPTFATAEFLVHRSREDIERILWLVKTDPAMMRSPYVIHLMISSWRDDKTSRSAVAKRERVGEVWTITLHLPPQRAGKRRKGKGKG